MASVAIDYTPAYEQGGGIGRYVRELVAALALQDAETDYRLFVAGAGFADLPPAPGRNFIWKPTRITPRWFARLWHRAYLPVPVEVITGKVQLYHATDFVLPPTLPRTRTLLTVHDLSFVRVPQAASPSLKAYLDAVVPRSVRRADCVLADSEATRDDLIEIYGVSPEKIIVLLSGVDAHFQRAGHEEQTKVLQKYRLHDAEFILSVGTVQPRKNYTRLIQSLAHLRREARDLHLVIAGGRGWLEDPIHRTIHDEGLASFVHFLGFVDEADLPGLYSAARCFAFPSLYEGFGLPVLEAMACGTPVMTSNVSSLPEVAGNAALLVDPYDLEAITDALRRLTDDSGLRSSMIQQGYLRAAQFTWKRSARHLQQLYQQILE